MKDTINTLVNQKPVEETIEEILKSLGYQIFSNKELEDMENKPVKFAIKNAPYQSIYRHRASSHFHIIDLDKNISTRVEIKIQKSSGSVDEKFPYLYLNAALSHKDDVIILLDGGGYKPGARNWLLSQAKNGWLLGENKTVKVLSLIEMIRELKENY